MSAFGFWTSDKATAAAGTVIRALPPQYLPALAARNAAAT